MKLLITLFLSAAMLHCNAQNELFTWKDHFSYRRVQHITSVNQTVYAATDIGAYSYNLEDNSITRYNKTNKLTDTGITCLFGVSEFDMLLVGYENGNLDILVDDQPVNLSDIKNSGIIAPKVINSMFYSDGFVYLCTGFGVVQLDLEKLEIKDTYYLGDNGTTVNVNDILIVDNEWIAATDLGLYKADVGNAFLSNFESWNRLVDTPNNTGSFTHLTFFNDFLYTSLIAPGGNDIYRKDVVNNANWELFQDTPNLDVRDLSNEGDYLIVTTKGLVTQYDSNLSIQKEVEFLGPGWTDNFQSIVSPDGNGIWIANNRDGLFHSTNGNGTKRIVPNGPRNSDVRRINSYFENVYATSGGVDLGYVNNFKANGINFYNNNAWGSITSENDDLMSGVNPVAGTVLDVMDIAIQPSDNSVVFASSWEEGLVEIKNNEVVEIHNTTNSPLVGTRPEFNNEAVYIDGITFDGNDNLWVTNSFTEDCLHVLTPGGEWHSFNFSPDVTSSMVLGEILVDRNNLVWIVLPRGEGVLVFDYNGTLSDTSDDKYRVLSAEEGDGGLPNEDVYSITEDVNGEIWIGTLQGVGIIYNTDCLFTEDECDAQQILIEQDGNFQLLLETETITSLEIDGGNRKWIGTQTSGAYLLSEDGIDQIYHLTKDNSPLLSDNIQDISFNFTTGEIFFATDLGIVSFIGSATGFDGDIVETKIYPNPVREDFDGTITIDGLTFKTDVRITDLNGNLVHETTSEGGRAVWNGRNESGNRVSSGVYLVFVSTTDGKETSVGKIAFVN